MTLTGALIAVLWLGSILAVASPASAQSVVRGVVTDDSLRRAVPGAQVRIEAAGTVAIAGRSGHYALAVPAGSHQITVRAIGYRPLTTSIEVGSRDTVTVDFRLTAAAYRLPDVTATADSAPEPTAKMGDFERRRRSGFGSFLTRAQLAANEAMPVSALLRVLRGVRLVSRPNSCGGGFSAATFRGGSAGNAGQPVYCPANRNDPFPDACYLAVFLDGLSLWAYTTPEPPNIDEFPASMLEGVEVYRGAAEMPAELSTMGAACGVLALWTRTGG